ncbi:MAG: GspE/PulE family protein [Candidatus Moranbacteria bacterium]|nr:GspE/PulE family protein [Candidatus Moranbacteria bacterium]
MTGEFEIIKEDINWDNIELKEDIIGLIPFESIKKYGFAPFRQDKKNIDLAVVDPEDVNTQNVLSFFSRKIDKKLRIFAIDEDEFKILLGKYKNPEIEIEKALKSLDESAKEEEKKASALKKREKFSIMQEAPVSKMVEVILKNAIDGKASDIHIEPTENKVRVRYRVDGILYNSILLPKKVGPAIVSRIKILSNLKIDEKRKPQDGRFRIEDMGRLIDFRVSTFPISHGEKVVMRILDKSSGLIKLEELGMKRKDFDLVTKTIQEPYGIILVTGPTGSGKSTTLYSILKMINNEGVNIVTLEDPIEYMIEGVSQSQVRPEIDYTFASGLRSILRQDPDIIMVGEIRDTETAELAIHAALTGHLVLSTLHTNTSVGAIPRLLDMGIQPFLLASSLKMVIGQRLVRKICGECKYAREEIPEGVELMIKKELSKVSNEVLEKSQIKRDDVVAGNFRIFAGKGCSKCMKTGMKGRLGIFEVLNVDNNISRIINKNINENEIEKMALKNGFTSMKQDGIIKVLHGLTTIEEVQRVTEDESEEEVIGAKGE